MSLNETKWLELFLFSALANAAELDCAAQEDHRERNHQGLDSRLIEATLANASNSGPIKCRERLGGVLNVYYRDAA